MCQTGHGPQGKICKCSHAQGNSLHPAGHRTKNNTINTWDEA